MTEKRRKTLNNNGVNESSMPELERFVTVMNLKRIESVAVTETISGHQIKRGKKQKVETQEALNMTFSQGASGSTIDAPILYHTSRIQIALIRTRPRVVQ